MQNSGILFLPLDKNYTASLTKFNSPNKYLERTHHDNFEISLSVSDGIVDQFCVLLHGSGLVDERRIRGSILGLQTLDGIDITGICDDDGQFLELFGLGRHGWRRSSFVLVASSRIYFVEIVRILCFMALQSEASLF